PRERVISTSTMWDHDGTGPMKPRVVCGGGLQTPSHIVSWDLGTGHWHTLGNGFGFVVVKVETSN
ncbi:MAG: hypothetical protein ACI9S9_004504, partial [Planctomycetota bacterium]